MLWLLIIMVFICYTKFRRKGKIMSDINIQWHMGFVAAMYLELRENRDSLIFDKEHNLNTKPLQIDLLVIKKDFPDDIRNEIGEFYRKYNIIEHNYQGD